MANITSSTTDTGQTDIPPPETLITTFWGPEHDQEQRNSQILDSVDISPYLEYYRRQWHTTVAYADGRYVTVRKYNDIVEIVKHLRQGQSKESILQYLAAGQPTSTITTEADDNSVNLAARLVSMLKIGIVKHQAIPRHCLIWKEGTLAAFIKARFDQPQVLSYQHVKLPKSFNAWSINVIGGLQINFTDNLDDHLLLVDDDTRVLIFHHASFLKCQHE